MADQDQLAPASRGSRPPQAAEKQAARPDDEQTESLGPTGPRQLNPVSFARPGSREENLLRTGMDGRGLDKDLRPNVSKQQKGDDGQPPTAQHLFSDAPEDHPDKDEEEPASSGIGGSKPLTQEGQPEAP